MTLAVSIFTIIAAIATVLYTIVTFRTLREIKAQRETTYRPDIIVDESLFYIYSSESQGISIPSEYSYDKKSIDYKPERPFANSFGVKLFNIGLASAKEIKVDFSFDIDEILKVVEQNGATVDENKKINAGQNNNLIEFKPVSNDIHLRSTHVINNQLQRELNHLLPVNIEPNPFVLVLPSYILQLNCLMIYNLWNNVAEHKSFPEFPGLKINIQYKDIGNKVHSKIIELLIQYHGGTAQESRCSIKATEKNCA